MSQWFCLDCLTTGHLTSHGRCSTCDSDAVVIATTQARYKFPREQEIDELNKLLEVQECNNKRD